MVSKPGKQSIAINMLPNILRSEGNQMMKFGYLKVVSTTFLLVYFVNLKEITCKTRKNIFYFTLKALFVPKIILDIQIL